jgi:hypothetical protein
LTTLAAVAAARDAETRMDALNYRNRAMNLQIIMRGADAAAALERDLEQSHRFAVDLESVNPTDSGTEVRLRIVGANP